MEILTIIDRITKLIESENLTPNSFANRLGIKATIIYNIQKGRNKPSFDLLVKIIDTFHLNANWLLLGEGNMKKETPSNDILLEADNFKSKIRSTSSLISDNDLTTAEINAALMQLANSGLLYLEFHLSDILLNLKFLQENLTQESFDRKEYERLGKTTSSIIDVMKVPLKTKQLSNNILLHSLLGFDDGMRMYLDKIRDLSKDLYLHTPKPK